jgi:DHA1 family bicyclomycin/chloramphenicol resistance-like MFS transporter
MPSTTKHRPGSLPSPGILLGLIAACMMMQPLSTDLYLATLPHLATYFDASPALVQQTLSSFVIAFGTAQLVVGPLSDRFGRRPVLLAGFAIYFVASLACALAPTIGVLIAGRFAQALGACCTVLVARAVVRDAYTRRRKVRTSSRRPVRCCPPRRSSDRSSAAGSRSRSAGVPHSSR